MESNPIITLETPLVVAASILAAHEAPILPLANGAGPTGVEKDGIRLFRAVGGQQVIRLIVKSKPSEYSKVIWAPCVESGMWLGALEYSSTLEDLLRVYEVTGFGDARVNGPAPPHALLTMDHVVSLYRERRLKCGISAEDVASRAIFIDPGAMLIDAMSTMCERRVRRLFLKDRKGEYVSDRAVLRFLFSPKSLAALKDKPESWTSQDVSKVQTQHARRLTSDATVGEVGKSVEPGRDVFVLPGGDLLVSRWDLVMKPWKLGKLAFN